MALIGESDFTGHPGYRHTVGQESFCLLDANLYQVQVGRDSYGFSKRPDQVRPVQSSQFDQVVYSDRLGV